MKRYHSFSVNVFPLKTVPKCKSIDRMLFVPNFSVVHDIQPNAAGMEYAFNMSLIFVIKMNAIQFKNRTLNEANTHTHCWRSMACGLNKRNIALALLMHFYTYRGKINYSIECNDYPL